MVAALWRVSTFSCQRNDAILQLLNGIRTYHACCESACVCCFNKIRKLRKTETRKRNWYHCGMGGDGIKDNSELFDTGLSTYFNSAL